MTTFELDEQTGKLTVLSTTTTTAMERSEFTVNSSGWSDLPLADQGRSWDEGAARSALANWAGIGGEDAAASAWAKYRRGFLWYDSSEPQQVGSYKFPIAMPIDGRLTIVPRAVNNAKARLSSASIPDADKSRMEGILNSIQRRGGFGGESDSDDSESAAGREAFVAEPSPSPETFQIDGQHQAVDNDCPDGKVRNREGDCVEPSSDDDDDSSYGVQAGAAPRPHPDVFANPNLPGPTPLTVGEDGRLWGHLASWDTCHTGIGNRCVMAPHTATGYAYFRTGEVLCSDSSRIPVGKITLGTGHADAQLGYIPAIAHYDDTGTVVAVVNVGEDKYGIWVAGTTVPGADEAKMAELRRSPLSGDWRRIGGNLELVAALAVNSPGFPVIRASAEDQLETLVAAGVVTEHGSEKPGPDDRLARWKKVEDVARNERVRELFGE